MILHRIILLICFLPLHLVAQKKEPQAREIQAFDAYVKQAVKDWQVPGLAVAVVKDGRVLLQKGYGVRESGKAGTVDTQTLFACASTTKAMTAVAMGILVDEGKVNWDDAVQKHLPDFLLYDPYVTREIRVRDLFTHNTGVGNADFLWGIMNITSDEVLSKMRDVEPSYSLRSSFIYQNIFYLAAGKIIEKKSGTPWHTFITERIFKPLGMKSTYSFLKDAPTENMTMPHDFIDGQLTVIEHFSADQIAPAGSVWSCIEDMSTWMSAMLDSSKYAGGRLLTAQTWTEMFKPQVIVPANQFYPTASLTKPNWTTYGLGWFQQDYKGYKMNFHTGSLAGAVAIHGQLPAANLGIYVFGNLDHAELRHALMYKAFDLFALGGTRDWSKELLVLYGNQKKAYEKTITDFEAKRTANTSPTFPLTAYEGVYNHPLFGSVEVKQNGNALTFIVNNLVQATLSHWHYDTFYGYYDKKWYGKGTASFALGTDGTVATLNMDGMAFQRSGR